MILKNAIYHAIGQAAGKVITFALFVYLARLLSVEKFGQFNFIFAYAAIFGLLMDFGMDILVPKLVAKNPNKLHFLISLFKFKLISIILVLGLYVAITMGLGYGKMFKTFFLAGLGTAIYSLVSFLFGIYRGKEALKYEAIFTIIHKLLFVSLAAYFVFKDFSLAGVFGALVFSSITVLLIAFGNILKQYGKLLYNRIDEEIKENAEIFKEALPFLFINICTVIYFRVDTLMISFLKSDFDVGIYNSAYRLMEGLIFIPGAFMTAFFPVLIRNANSGRYDLIKKFKEGLISLCVIGLLISGILFIGADIFINLFWGPRYVDAVPILKILALALLIIHFNYLITQTIIAQNNEKIYMVTVICTVLINIGLNFPLIRIYGAKGAALSTIATELFLGSVLFIKFALTNRKDVSEIELL